MTQIIDIAGFLVASWKQQEREAARRRRPAVGAVPDLLGEEVAMSRKTLAPLTVLFLVAWGSSAGAWPGCEVDELSAVVQGDALIVYHDRAAYNCCLDSVTYAVSQEPGTISITEHEALTIPCLCLCCFDLSVEVDGLAAGTYTLVFTWYDYDTHQTEQWTTQVTMPGSGGQPRVAAVSNSGCLDLVPSPREVESGSWGRVKTLYR